MKSVLFICLFMMPFCVPAKSVKISNKSTNLNSIIVDNKLFPGMDSNWRFINADDTAMAQPGYNDSNWIVTKSSLEGDSGVALLNGIGWFRKRLYVPDSTAKMSLSMAIVQYGASAVYVDGVLLNEYGKIGKSADSTEYYNPVLEPFVFHFKDTGYHTIAVRYANYRDKVPTGSESYIHGFELRVAEANQTYTVQTVLRIAIFAGFIGLGCIFMTLAGLHFLLWIFRRKDKSNLFLSILCMIVCLYFFLNCYWSQTSDTDVEMNKVNGSNIMFGFALIALSALINDLFGSYKLRFWIIVALCSVSLWMTIEDTEYKHAAYSLSIMVVMIEAIVLLVRAMRHKIKGAGILGFSILPMAVVSLIGVVAEAVWGKDITDQAAALIVLGMLQMIAYACIPVSMSVFLAWRFGNLNKTLANQLTQVKELSEKTQKQEAEKQHILENQKAELEMQVTERTSEIAEEKKKSDDLLLNILPEEVAKELKEKGTTTAHAYDKVTVMFTDFVDFTVTGARMGSQELVEELHNCFKAFDGIMGKYGIEKIKTIGDAYLAVCGLPTADEQHAEKVVRAAQEIRQFMLQRRGRLGDKTFEIRIGIHSGEVVAGIVGVKKFAYDIWGDTVNTAARMESNSVAGHINISETTYDLVKDKFTCTYRGEIEAKGKGMLKMYFVEG